MRILIVEDEPLAQQELKRMLGRLRPDAEIVAAHDSIEDTVALLQESPKCCDLILMDIELADGSSFSIFDQVQVMIPVVFVTAYNEHALRAFKVNSIDYLLKPLDEEALEQAICKYENLYDSDGSRQAEPQWQDVVKALSGQASSYKTRFVAMVGDRIKYIPVEEIAYFFAEDNTVFLVQHDKRRYVINNNLEQIETMVDPQHFFRITRKYLANIKAIGDVFKHFNSRLKVTLSPPVEDAVLVSRVKVPEFMKWLGG